MSNITVLSSRNESWAKTGGIIISISVLIFTIYQFNVTQTAKTQLEFIDHLEFYDSQFLKINQDYTDSDHAYQDCKTATMKHLMVLERLSYLKSQNLVTPEFVNYFNSEFHSGTTNLLWLKFMETSNWNANYPNFVEIEKTLEPPKTTHVSQLTCMYYVEKKDKDSNYNPYDDEDGILGYGSGNSDVFILYRGKT